MSDDSPYPAYGPQAGGWPGPSQQPYQPYGQPRQPYGGGWQQPPWPPVGYPPPRRRTPSLLIAVTLVVVVAVAAGVTLFFVGRSDPEKSWVAQTDAVLRSSYANEPDAGWSVRLRDVEDVIDEDLDDFEWGGARDYGNVVLTSVESIENSDDGFLVAIDAATGAITWATPSDGHSAYMCADEAVGGLLICSNPLSDDEIGGPQELRFYSVATGELDRTDTISGLRHANVRNGVVYTAGWDDDEAWIARGTVDELEAGWREEYAFGDCLPPDWGGSVHIDGNTVSYADFIVDADTGELINPRSTYATLLPGDELFATTSCSGDDFEFERRTWDVIDSSGSTQWSHTSDGRGYIVYQSGAAAGAPYFTGNTAYDSSNGDELWSVPGDVSLWGAYGSVVLGDDLGGDEDYYDDVTVAFDATTGDELWSSDDISYCEITDGSRCISSFYREDSDNEIAAYNLETGEQDWSLGTVEYGGVSVAGDGFVVVEYDADITYYPPPD